MGLRLACRLSWAPSQPWAVSQGPGMWRAGSSPGPCELRRLPAPARPRSLPNCSRRRPVPGGGGGCCCLGRQRHTAALSRGSHGLPEGTVFFWGKLSSKLANTSSAPSQNQAKRLRGGRAGPRRALGPGPRALSGSGLQRAPWRTPACLSQAPAGLLDARMGGSPAQGLSAGLVRFSRAPPEPLPPPPPAGCTAGTFPAAIKQVEASC